MRLKLATCEAELEGLLENQATVEKELQSKNCHLQAELSQATAQKVSASGCVRLPIR